MKKRTHLIVVSVLLLLVVTSCKNTWSREDKATFYQACTEEAKPWTGSAEKAKTYCDCVFANMEKKYPNEEDALEHIDSLAKDSALLNCKGAVMVK